MAQINAEILENPGRFSHRFVSTNLDSVASFAVSMLDRNWEDDFDGGFLQTSRLRDTRRLRSHLRKNSHTARAFFRPSSTQSFTPIP